MVAVVAQRARGCARFHRGGFATVLECSYFGPPVQRFDMAGANRPGKFRKSLSFNVHNAHKQNQNRKLLSSSRSSGGGGGSPLRAKKTLLLVGVNANVARAARMTLPSGFRRQGLYLANSTWKPQAVIPKTSRSQRARIIDHTSKRRPLQVKEPGRQNPQALKC